MKVSKLSLYTLFVAISIFASGSLYAQEAKKLFVSMPDSLCPLLTSVNRADCIDFLESKMKAEVDNRFGKKSEMTDLSKDYIRMQMSPQTTWQMKVLALSDTTKIVCAISTACAPACDSSFSFYTTDWKGLPASRYISLPALGDFLTTPDSTTIYAFEEVRNSVDLLLMKADFNKESSELTIALTTMDYLSDEVAGKLKEFYRGPVVYKWADERFVRKE